VALRYVLLDDRRHPLPHGGHGDLVAVPNIVRCVAKRGGATIADLAARIHHRQRATGLATVKKPCTVTAWPSKRIIAPLKANVSPEVARHMFRLNPPRATLSITKC
jgi:hypothetical protein